MLARPGSGLGPGRPGWAVITAQTKAACLARLVGALRSAFGPGSPLPAQVLPGLGPGASYRHAAFPRRDLVPRAPASAFHFQTRIVLFL